jgi:hypothetical protein
VLLWLLVKQETDHQRQDQRSIYISRRKDKRGKLFGSSHIQSNRNNVERNSSLFSFVLSNKSFLFVLRTERKRTNNQEHGSKKSKLPEEYSRRHSRYANPYTDTGLINRDRYHDDIHNRRLCAQFSTHPSLSQSHLNTLESTLARLNVGNSNHTHCIVIVRPSLLVRRQQQGRKDHPQAIKCTGGGFGKSRSP